MPLGLTWLPRGCSGLVSLKLNRASLKGMPGSAKVPSSSWLCAKVQVSPFVHRPSLSELSSLT